MREIEYASTGYKALYPANGIFTFVTDRSDPNEVVCIIPKGNPNFPQYPDGKALTRLENLELRDYHRKDIGMITINYADKGEDQFFVEPDEIGEPIWGSNKKYFTKQEQQQIIDICKRIYQLSLEYPAFKKLLSKRY